MQTIIVTGASQGIGREFVRQYARAGEHVIAAARDLSLDNETILKAYGNVTCLPLDVSDERSILSFKELVGNLPINLLINNAGMGDGEPGARFGSLDMAHAGTLLAVNMLAPVKLAEVFLDNLTATRGTIVMISSDMGSLTLGTGGSHLYRASKAALNAATKALGHDLTSVGITAVAMHPGSVQTRMGGYKDAAMTPMQSVTQMRATIPKLSALDAGSFITYEGQRLPW